MQIFFFFQAEDGIRDKLVTGVQTCALPILGAVPRVRASSTLRGGAGLAGLLRLALPAPAGLLRPRGGAGLLRLALTATTPSLLDPSLPALPNGRSPLRRGPRRSRSRSTFRIITSVRLPRLAVGTEPLACFLKF